MAPEPGADFERWMMALVPLTGELIRELHEVESSEAGTPFNPWHNLYMDGHPSTVLAWEDAL